MAISRRDFLRVAGTGAGVVTAAAVGGELASRLGRDEAIRAVAIEAVASQGSAEYLRQCDRNICAQVESTGIHLRQMSGEGGNKLRAGVVEEGALLPPTIGSLTRMFPPDLAEYGGKENLLVVQYMAGTDVDAEGKPTGVGMIIHTPLAGAGLMISEEKLGGEVVKTEELRDNYGYTWLASGPSFAPSPNWPFESKMRWYTDDAAEALQRGILNYTTVGMGVGAYYAPSADRRVANAIPCACGSFLALWTEASQEEFYRVNEEEMEVFPKPRRNQLYAYVPLWEADWRTKNLATMNVGRLGNFAGDKLYGWRLAGVIDLERVWFSPGGGGTDWTDKLSPEERKIFWPTREPIGGTAAAWVGARKLAEILKYPEPATYRTAEYLKQVIEGGLNLPVPTPDELAAAQAMMDGPVLASAPTDDLVQKLHVPAINLLG